MLYNLAAIQSRVDGEPPSGEPSARQVAAALVSQVVILALVLPVGLVLWCVYLPLRVFLGRPPVVPATAQILQYLGCAWTERAPPPGIPASLRLRFFLAVLRVWAIAPLGGLAWFLDLLLYGSALRDTPVVAPLFELSAARSGSTQLAHYLEEEPQIVAPSFIQMMFPYLWLWRLAPSTLGRFMTRERVTALHAEFVGPLFLERHEGDPFRSETFDLALYGHALNGYGRLLGPAMTRRDCSFGSVYANNRRLWDEDFVTLVDGLGRRALLHAGPGPDGRPRRLLIKGHFIAGADALERRYPDACFLTIVREPVARIRSVLNFLAVAPSVLDVGRAPWPWLVEGLLSSEIDYCDLERVWYDRKGARRCIVRFDDYVQDLEGTMRRIYRECLGEEQLPPHVLRTHVARVRSGYTIDRTLSQMGIDELALAARLADYEEWRTKLSRPAVVAAGSGGAQSGVK